MAEVLFYHLTASPLEATLPGLLEKCLERGWRVLVRCGSETGLAALDAALWTYRDDAFLPHGTESAGSAERQPILLSLGTGNPNAADVLMLVDGARGRPEEMRDFVRTCLLFDGGDARALEAAREDWRAVAAAGVPATYWAQDQGRWVRKATSPTVAGA